MLSKVNSVISDCLGETVPSLFVPEPKTFGHTQACRSGKGWRFFRYTDAEKILLLGRLPGRVMFGQLQSIRRWAGGLSSFCSDPIPPVAVATDQLAEHVLSRSAGTEASSSIPMNIIGHHSPNKAGKCPGHCRYRNVSFLPMPY